MTQGITHGKRWLFRMQKTTNGNTKGGILQTGMPPDAQKLHIIGHIFSILSANPYKGKISL